jgi:NAD(P)-dependent dehydrogenase (short-subunit alcohol dehydrogenase family)
MEQRVALVTGANRGIGREVVRQLARLGHVVILGSRELHKGEQAAAELAQEGGHVLARQLDVSSDESVRRLMEQVEEEQGRLDILVNNAAILYDTWQRGVTADLDVVREALETNLFGAWRTAQACIPLMRRHRWGRIVNVSSGAGSLARMGGGTPAYSVSKAALNALTRILGAELRIAWDRHSGQRHRPGVDRNRHGRVRWSAAGRRRPWGGVGRDAPRWRPYGRVLL